MELWLFEIPSTAASIATIDRHALPERSFPSRLNRTCPPPEEFAVPALHRDSGVGPDPRNG